MVSESELLRYKNLLLAKQRELSTRKTLVGPIRTADEPHADPVDMAVSQIGAAGQIRLSETDSKLLRAIDDALIRLRQGRFGTCEECAQPISKARLEAVPWARHCKDCKERQNSRS